jgi:hypothetical protein
MAQPNKPKVKVYRNDETKKQPAPKGAGADKGSRAMIFTLLGIALLIVLVIIIFSNLF